ncbi:MAG: hypothetical protein QGH47_06730, partial [Candidatus Woesearchaeota archaeon]|nr:hypothetical protein [Candidatus Woesearchaeota archaeon]
NSKLSLKTKDIGWDIIATGTTDSTQTRIAGGPPLLFIRDSLSGKKHLTISGAGNIGIGTTTPGATLEVKGTMKVFGNWETKTLETVYQAPSDGFVTILTGGSGSNIWASFITDSSNPPQTSRVRVGPFDGASSPVRKGDFWRVHKTGGTTTDKIHIYWIPLGT